MSVMAEAYDLKELCRLAEVTPRTVHFYIQQGVLPPAGTRGPGARYARDHLARLLLVKRLQREHLPLSEIRQRLEALTDEEVALVLAESSPRTPEAGGSALDYVRQVLATSGKPAAPVPPASAWRGPSAPGGGIMRWLDAGAAVEPHAARALRADLLHAELHEPASRVVAARALRSPAGRPLVPDRSQWERHVLTPDVELHLRRPLTREMNRRVERLLAAARDILQEA